MERLINEGWTKINGERIEDLESYIFNQYATKNELSVMIGTDSALRGEGRAKTLKFLTVIVFKSVDENFRDVNHIIKRRAEEILYGKVPTAVKLNGEINRTSELALWFRETIQKDPEVHLDVNPKENAGSFEVYKYIKGYFESLQFVCEYKPDSPAASFAADFFL